ncbi:hypothetical protein BD408DRAFT_447110 [Parasitella parasitica]|nr:hypothetical protein BD408DRAFT_447110 [Parasitella parasitica]
MNKSYSLEKIKKYHRNNFRLDIKRLEKIEKHFNKMLRKETENLMQAVERAKQIELAKMRIDVAQLKEKEIKLMKQNFHASDTTLTEGNVDGIIDD